MGKEFTVKFIGDPPENREVYLDILYSALREAAESDPREDGEEQLRKERTGGSNKG